MNDVQTGAQMLAAIKPTLRELGTGICLRPDLIDEWAEADADLTEAKVNDAGNQRLASGGVSADTKRKAEKVRQIEDLINESEIRFVFRKMPVAQHQVLKDQHPPRQGDQIDMMMGFDRDAVSNQMVRDCLISPVFTDCVLEDCAHVDCGSWQQLLTVLGPTEWSELQDTCNEVNGALTKGPKSLLASQILDRPETTRKRRAVGA